MSRYPDKYIPFNSDEERIKREFAVEVIAAMAPVINTAAIAGGKISTCQKE